MRTFAFVVLTLVGSMLVSSVPAKENPSYVTKVFHDEDFLPYVYDESEIISRYGSGLVSRADGLIHRSYFDKSSDRWATFVSDQEVEDSFRTISEISVSTLGPVSTAGSSIEPLAHVGLFGVCIGDPASAALEIAKGKYGMHTTEVRFFGVEVDQLTFFTSEDNTSTYYRYLIRDGVVAGMVIGITE